MICLLIRDLGEVGDLGAGSGILGADSKSPILYEKRYESEESCAASEPGCLQSGSAGPCDFPRTVIGLSMRHCLGTSLCSYRYFLNYFT